MSRMTDSVMLSDNAHVQERLGVARLTRAVYQRQNISPILSRLKIALTDNPNDAAALMDLSVLEQLNGNLEGGLGFQSAALDICQQYRTKTGAKTAFNLLALAAPIEMGGNTPIEFLLEGSEVCLTTLYVSSDRPLPSPLPEHDAAMVIAPGDSDSTRQFLRAIEDHLAHWPRPVLNMPQKIRNTEREQLYALLGGHPKISVPTTIRCNRALLGDLGQGSLTISDVLPGLDFPVIVRPVGAHAGRNLEKLTCYTKIESYLKNCQDPEFFVSEFLDYRSADGAFRKFRIVFVNGHPLPCHMAIADEWKVWYLNAEMGRSRAKRAEEEDFMVNFNRGFGVRHGEALSAIAQSIELEYFGVDCAESSDGRLIVFEADNALIVHDMDSDQVFPYKKPQMQNIFSAFVDMVLSRKDSKSTFD